MIIEKIKKHLRDRLESYPDEPINEGQYCEIRAYQDMLCWIETEEEFEKKLSTVTKVEGA